MAPYKSIFEDTDVIEEELAPIEVTPVPPQPSSSYTSVFDEPIVDDLPEEDDIEVTAAEEQASQDWIDRFTSWSWNATKATGRTLARMPVRAVDDLVKTTNDLFSTGIRKSFEREWFDKPKSAVEDITADIGSYLGTFWIPGGAVVKTGKVVSKVTKVGDKAADLAKLIKTKKGGEKALRVGKIASEGALRGAVADYITTDTEDKAEEDKLKTRAQGAIEGLFLGAGINLGFSWVQRTAGVWWKKQRALKKVVKASQGKGDATVALKELDKAIKEEDALKNDITSEVNITDERLEPQKTTDELLAEADEAVERIKEPVKKEEPPIVGEPPKPPVKPKEKPRDPELEIEEYIMRAKTLPEQINKMAKINQSLASEMNPKISTLFKDLGQGNIDAVKKQVLGLETELRRYRKLIDVNVQAGNITGKSLVAFKGKTMDFRKPPTYKPEVAKRVYHIEKLLQLTDDISKGRIDESQFMRDLKADISSIDDLAKGRNFSDVSDEAFVKIRDESTNSIWSKYKQRISDGVIRTLKIRTPQDKAALELFSNNVKDVITGAVKNDKTVAKKADTTLQKIQDIFANPEKYKESLQKLRADITKAKGIKADDKARALDSINSLIDGETGKRFFDVLPNRTKLLDKTIKAELKEIGTNLKEAVNNGTEKELVREVMARISQKIDLGPFEKEALITQIRSQLTNAISEIKNDVILRFKSKELFQKFRLRDKIKDLEDLQDKSIEEIRAFLKQGQPQNVPEDVQFLKERIKEARQTLKDKVQKEDNELALKLLKELSGLQEFDAGSASTWELSLRALEKLRTNTMLFSPRTWFVGVPTSIFNMAYQPVARTIQAYYKGRANQFMQLDHKQAMDYALAEWKAQSEYFSGFRDAWHHIKETWKNNGKSSWMKSSLRRHEEDLFDITGEVTSEPLKLPFRDREKLTRLVNKYGQDTKENQSNLRRFLMDMIDGEPSTQFAKALDPLFSISFRAMGIMDEGFKVLGTLRALRAEAMQDVLWYGTKEELGKDVFEDAVKRRMEKALEVNEGIRSWTRNEDFNKAEQLGLALVYQADYADKAFSQMAKSFAKWSRGGADSHTNFFKILARLQVPFIKTPTAIMQFTLDHFPGLSQFSNASIILGNTPAHRLLKETIKSKQMQESIINAKNARPEDIKRATEVFNSLSRNQDELYLKTIEMEAEAVSNFVLGTTFLFGFTAAAYTGNITGSGAFLSNEQKQRLTNAGWRPNSIRIGDTRISYTKLEPWSTFLSVISDLVHFRGMMGENLQQLTEEDQSLYSAVHGALVENLANKTFVRGLYEILEATSNKDKQIADIPLGWAASFTPTILRDLNSMNDQFQRQAVGWRNKLKDRALGIHPGQYRRNILGEKVNRIYSMEGFWGVVSPITWSDAEVDDVMTELAGLRDSIGFTRSYEKDKLNTSEYYNEDEDQTLYDYWMDEVTKTRITGLTLREELKRIFNSTEYLDAPLVKTADEDMTQADLVKEAVTAYRNEAWLKIKDKDIKFINSDGENWKDQQLKNIGVKAEDLKSLTEPGFIGF
jgi:hypothetical protein